MNVSILQFMPRRYDGRLRHITVERERLKLGNCYWFAWYTEEGLSGPHGEGYSRREALADLVESAE